jgi:hypothetical protein
MAIEGFQNFITKDAVISALVTAGKQSSEVHGRYRREYERIQELYRTRQAKEFGAQESAHAAKRVADLEVMMGCLDHLQGPSDELRKACEGGLEKIRVEAVERLTHRQRKAEKVLAAIAADKELLARQRDAVIGIQKSQEECGLMPSDSPMRAYVKFLEETTDDRLEDLGKLESEYKHCIALHDVLIKVVDSGAEAVRGHMKQMLSNVEGAKTQLVADLGALAVEAYIYYSDMQARFDKERVILEKRRERLDDALEEAMFSHIPADDIESQIANNEMALQEVSAKETGLTNRKAAAWDVMDKLCRDHGCVLPMPPDVAAWRRDHESYWVIERVRPSKSIADLGKLAITEGGKEE